MKTVFRVCTFIDGGVIVPINFRLHFWFKLLMAECDFEDIVDAEKWIENFISKYPNIADAEHPIFIMKLFIAK